MGIIDTLKSIWAFDPNAVCCDLSVPGDARERALKRFIKKERALNGGGGSRKKLADEIREAANEAYGNGEKPLSGEELRLIASWASM